MSREQEAHLFRKMNYLKYRANQLKEQLDPDRPSPGRTRRDRAAPIRGAGGEEPDRRDEPAAGRLHRQGGTSGPVTDLAECVSDGNLALLQAVDGFDFARGNKFSTYATWAIRNTLARNEQRSIRPRSYPFASYEESLAGTRLRHRRARREEVQDQRRSVVRRWLGRLDKRERRILASRYGIGGGPEQTLHRSPRRWGSARNASGRSQTRAQTKLRKFARLEALEPLEI